MVDSYHMQSTQKRYGIKVENKMQMLKDKEIQSCMPEERKDRHEIR